MITNKNINDNEIKYLNLLLSNFADYAEEIARQISAAKIEREEYSDHLFIYFSYENNFEPKYELPFLLTLGLECTDKNNVDIILCNDNGLSSELEVFSNLFAEISCESICNGSVYWKSIYNADGSKTVWTLNKKTQKLELNDEI